jgi:hypothetical protein
MRLLFEASAPVHAPLDEVQRLIDDEWVLDVFFRSGPAGRQYVDVDHRDGAVGFQGHWWYRGEIGAATGVDGRTEVTYRVYNIAGASAWAVPLANRLFIGYRRTVREAAGRLARAIDAHLAGPPS